MESAAQTVRTSTVGLGSVTWWSTRIGAVQSPSQSDCRAGSCRPSAGGRASRAESFCGVVAESLPRRSSYGRIERDAGTPVAERRGRPALRCRDKRRSSRSHDAERHGISRYTGRSVSRAERRRQPRCPCDRTQLNCTLALTSGAWEPSIIQQLTVPAHAR